jgi:dTMP kinase
MIFVLDGIDGSGKTTLAEYLRNRLRELTGQPAVYMFRDPGGTPAGERIRAVVKDGDVPMCANAQMLAFSAARAQLAHEAILPIHEDGGIVILDRWWFSTWAYQSIQGVDPTLIEHIAEHTAKVPLDPKACFWMEVEPERALRRVQQRDTNPRGHDRFDQKGLEFRTKLDTAYSALWERGLLQRLDANGPIAEVWMTLWNHVMTCLGTNHPVPLWRP